ncbi:hypothetical protein, partial [Serratia marcescens]|uniref:hypothetical protein n=1 Tax=Serratia marcescens TaxID=615 RepID=UPI003D76E95D
CLAEEEQQSPLLTPMLASAARLKLPVLPQVGPNYIGMWVIFTSVLTDMYRFCAFVSLAFY